MGSQMPTKALQRFEDRVSAYASDLELADLLVRKFCASASTPDTIAVFLDGSVAQYPNLNRRENNRTSRNIVGPHMKVTLYAAFIKDLYEDFSEYLATSMKKAALAGLNPAQFQGDAKLDLQAKEILQVGSWENAVALISEKIFRSLENEKSTITLINKVSGRLGLALEPAILSSAMPYLDARHILVHRDGRVDAAYTGSYPGIPVREGKLKIDYDFVRNARTSVRALASHIDERLCAAHLVRQQDMIGGQQN
jgi:hypothetical protein